MTEKNDVQEKAGTIGVPTTPKTPKRPPIIVILWNKVVEFFTGKKKS